MPSVSQKIPLIQKPYPALDSIISMENSAELIDGILDEKGGMRRRPGLFQWTKLLTSPDDAMLSGQGTFWWESKGIFIAVAGGRVFANNTGDPAQFFEITTTMTKLHPTNMVSFACSGGWLIMANGRVDQTILEWNGVSTLASFSTTAPKNTVKVAYIDTYFLALPTSSQIYWFTYDTANIVDPPKWRADYVLSADGNPDLIQTIAVGWREIFVIGSLSVEPWFDAGNALPEPPFSRMEGTFIEQGISAPNSLALLNNSCYWLNHTRDIVCMTGHSPKIISLPIQSQLKGYQIVSDAIGFAYDRFYCISFPTADITWVYDTLIDVWYQWGKFYPELEKYTRWLVNSVTFVPKWGIHFASCFRDSNIYFIHQSLCTDAGDVIAMQYTSGLIDRGTFRRKVSHELILKLKRGMPEEKMFGLIPSGQSLMLDIPDATRCSFFSYTFPNISGDISAISVSGLDSALTYDQNSRTIEGTPLDSGTYDVTISVTMNTGLVIPIKVKHVIHDIPPVILFPGE